MTLLGEPLHWRHLVLGGVSSDQAKAALVALAALPGRPRIVLEAVGTAGRVSWRIGTRPERLAQALAAIATHVPSARVEVVDVTVKRPGVVAAAGTAASVRLPGSRHLPLRYDAGEAVTRSLLAALADTQASEELRIQLVLGPRLRPRRVRDIDVVERRAVTIKLGEHGFGCALRVQARAATPQRAHSLVLAVGAALRGLEVPGVVVRLNQTSDASVARAASPWFWPLWLRVSDLVPLICWPTASLPLPGVPPLHPRILPPATASPRVGRVLGRAVSRSDEQVRLSTLDSLRHLHVLGPSGVGKSTLLAHLAVQDIERGHGVVVIDPKGDLVDDILRRVPDERMSDVVVIDGRDEAVVGINGLNGQEPERAADVLLGVFHQLYADAWGPRTHDILHACLLTLARRGDASLAMVPLLLTNPGVRRSLVGRVARQDPMGLGSFWAWFEGISDAERTQAIAPLMNKLRPILLRPGLRGIFGQRRPKVQLRQVFSERKVVLVSLAKGAIGPEAARLLGSLVVALVWQEALARVNLPESARQPVFVHVDEVQDYLALGPAGDVADALAQARGLGVGFTLAHQHLGQLPPSLRSAVLANARSRVSFALSPDDAVAIARTTSGVLEPEDFRALPAFQAYAHLLSGGETLAPVSVVTEPLGAPRRTVRAARVQARERYARPLTEVESDLLVLAGYPPADASGEPADGPAAGNASDNQTFGRRRRGPSTSAGGLS